MFDSQLGYTLKNSVLSFNLCRQIINELPDDEYLIRDVLDKFPTLTDRLTDCGVLGTFTPHHIRRSVLFGNQSDGIGKYPGIKIFWCKLPTNRTNSTDQR